MTLELAVTLDVLVVVLCAAVLFARAGLRHSHPAVVYLVFHVLIVTGRAAAVAAGAPTLLSGVPGFERITEQEIARAVNMADLFLVAITAGWVRSAARPVVTVDSSRPSRSGLPRWLPLQPRYFIGVAIVATPFSIYSIFRYAYVPGIDRSLVAVDSSYPVLAVTWPGLTLVALIYLYGFRGYLLAPLVLYLAVIGLQGYSRFRLVIPVILLCQIYLDRRGRRWPGPGILALAVLLSLLFIPLKDVGRGIQEGAGAADVVRIASERLTDGVRGRDGDQALLDQLGAVLTLTDRNEKVFFGRPYANVLVLPVPREFWPGKPGLADYLAEISTPGRPLGQIGAITTLPGDLYLNFRLPGLVLGGYLLGLGTGLLYRRAYAAPYLSVRRLFYLLLASNLLQIARDGLVSVPVFLLVNMLPLIVLVLLHYRGLSPGSAPPQAVYPAIDRAAAVRRDPWRPA